MTHMCSQSGRCFSAKTACHKYFFRILSQKNAPIMNSINPLNPGEVRTYRIHNPFLSFPKETINPFSIQNLDSDFSQSNAPLN